MIIQSLPFILSTCNLIMGGMFSRKKSRNSSPRRHRRLRHEKVTSSSENDLLLSHNAPSVKERKQNLFKHSSIDDISLGEFQDYVKKKKQTMTSDAEFEKDCIKSHNDYRENHHARALKRKDELTRHAQQWANQIAATGQFKHSNNRNYGENIAMTSKKDPSGQEITAMWYDEIKKYNFKKPGFASGTGHFTQVVWKGSTHIGIGIARGRAGTFVVANYEPAGNIANRGYFEDNVAPPIKGAKINEQPRRNRRERRSSSSSSSSSSSDDNERQGSSREGTKTETNVKTNVKEFTDKQGRRVRETTKTTTTITRKGGSKSTSTKTEVNTEYIDDRSVPSMSGAHVLRDENMGNKLRLLKVDDVDKESKMSGKDRLQFQQECIDRHNELRRKHGAPSLRKSSSLQEKAQKWAEHLEKLRRLQHSSERDVGENIAYKYSSDERRFTGAEITDMWYDEINKYDFKKAGFSQGTGHFTQVVWENTKEIGVGIASDGKGTIFVVANYSPAGNFTGEFEKNVKKARR